MKSAFTLIELLVVIAIIAVLAAILFPVLAQARQAAKRAGSLSGVRQLGIAWQMYASDHDDAMVLAMTYGPGAAQTWWWGVYDVSAQVLHEERGPLYPYTRSKGIQVDPSFDNRLRSRIGFTGFGYNYWYLGSMRSVSYGEISSPAETVAFGSSARINNWQYAVPSLEGNPYLDPPSQNFPGFHGRMNGTGNVVWCDLHAQSLHPKIRKSDFGSGFHAADFQRAGLGDLDRDGNLATDELFDLN